MDTKNGSCEVLMLQKGNNVASWLKSPAHEFFTVIFYVQLYSLNGLGHGEQYPAETPTWLNCGHKHN